MDGGAAGGADAMDTDKADEKEPPDGVDGAGRSKSGRRRRVEFAPAPAAAPKPAPDSEQVISLEIARTFFLALRSGAPCRV